MSRFHSTLSFTKNGVILTDNESKFGTLVHSNSGVEIEPQREIAIQIGKTVLSLELRGEQMNEHPIKIKKR